MAMDTGELQAQRKGAGVNVKDLEALATGLSVRADWSYARSMRCGSGTRASAVGASSLTT